MTSPRTIAAKFRSFAQSLTGTHMKKSRARRSTRRGLLFDQLEERRVMAFNGFAAPVMLNTGDVAPHDVTVADINRDGRQDLVVAHSSVDRIHVYLGNGQGGFQLHTTASTNGSHGNTVQVADVTGDGWLDILASRGGRLQLLRQGTGSSFSAPIDTGVLHDGGLPLAIGDLNNDGRPDIIAGRFGGLAGDWFIESWMNNGNGSFVRSQTLDNGPYTTNGIVSEASLQIADINGDGRADAVLAGRDMALRTFLGNGNGTFAMQNLGPGSAPGFRGLKLRDLNGDGRPDVMVANEANNTVGVRLNQGNGVFGAITNYAVGDVPLQLEVGDIDADGLLDLITANRGPLQNTSARGDRVSFLKGNGNGTFQNSVDYLTGSTSDATIQPSDVALGDFNGDGLLDAIVGHNQATFTTLNDVSTRVSVLLATGTASPPDYAGNSLGTARDLGVLTGTQTFGDFVGNTDTADFYRFRLTQRSDFSLVMNGLRADVDVVLKDANGQAIASSTYGGSSAESISRTLDTGTYYVHVYPYGGAESNYNLSLTATSVVGPAYLQYSQSTYVFDEGIGTAIVTVIRTGDLNQTSSVSIGTSYSPGRPDGATPGRDFELSETTLVFCPGESVKTFSFRILEDQIVEGTEWMGTVMNLPSAGTSIIGGNLASVLITDNDRPNLRVLSAYISDQHGNRIDGPRAGMPWFVTVNFLAVAIAANSSYQIRQTIDGGNAMDSTTSLGSGASGTVIYRHTGNAWRGMPAGPHAVRVSLDPGGWISESNESDNVFTFNFVATIGDLAGNTLNSARHLGLLDGTCVYQDHVHPSDSTDVYRFTLNSRRNFAATLSDVSANIDLELLDAYGRVLAYSRKVGTAIDALARTLETGTYYVRVRQGHSTASTAYSLTLSATDL